MTGLSAALPLVWIITDGKAGMESQCRAVVARLGLTAVEKRVRLRSPWRYLSPWGLRIGHELAIAAAGDQLDPPLPDLLIASGRHSVTASRAVARLTQGRCLRVQIQNPGIPARHFDLVAVPQHDGVTGERILVTRGAPHSVTAATLAAARQHFAARLAALPRPRLAVLLGGDNGVYRFSTEAAASMADCLATLLRGNNGSLLLTPSRRTGAAVLAICRDRLQHLPGEIWDGSGDNPYIGYLAYADQILVTADSVNMVCEAAATGQPVQIIPLDGGSAKFRRFHAELMADDITRPFTGRLEQWSHPTFDDAGLIAGRIRALLAGRGWTLPPDHFKL